MEVINIDKSQMSDCASLAPRVREADKREIFAAQGVTPITALIASVRASSHAYTVTVDDEPEIMFGVVPASIVYGHGVPWLLASDYVEKRPLTFLRGSVKALEDITSKYDSLANFVDARNTHAIRWLDWLGFEVGEPIDYGLFQLPFHPFVMEVN